MSELNVCKASLTINEQILAITRNQRNVAMNRLDSLAMLTNKTIVDNELLKFDMQDLRKTKRKSKLENWIWRFGAIFTTYYILKK
jgi:ABC-type proline/glycine betaine transport system ATPase subunit